MAKKTSSFAELAKAIERKGGPEACADAVADRVKAREQKKGGQR